VEQLVAKATGYWVGRPSS